MSMTSEKHLSPRVARFLFRFNTTVIAVFLFLALCLLPFSLRVPSPLDHALQKLLSRWVYEPEGSLSTAVVTVPEEEARLWVTDAYSADALRAMLGNVLHLPRVRIVLLFERPLAGRLNSLDKLIDDSAEVPTEFAQVTQKKRYLTQLLAEPRVYQSTAGPLASVERAAEAFGQDYFSRCLFSPRQQPVWMPERCAGAYRLDAAAAANGWLRNLLMDSGVDDLPSQWFVLAPSEVVGPLGRIPRYTLEEAVASNAFPDVLLVGPESQASHLERTAAVIEGLRSRELFVLPNWYEPALRVLLVVLAAYAFLLHFRVPQRRWRGVLLLLIALLICVIPIVLGLWRRYWLPPTPALLALSLLLPLCWLQRHLRLTRQYEQHLLTQAIQLAGMRLEEASEQPAALALYRHLPNRKHALASLLRGSDPRQHLRLDLGHARNQLELAASLVGDSRELRHQIHMLHSLEKNRAREQPLEHDPSRPQSLGRYQLQRELGRGAVGVVYLGYDPAITRQLAIKTFDARQLPSGEVDGLKLRFLRESKAAGSLSHPHIVAVYDVGEEHGIAYIAMDYVEGVALSEHTREGDLLSPARVYRIVHDAALALHYAHQNGIVHRDIKPGNLMYQAEPYTLKVTDFGVARLLDHSATTTGEILGSPLYMAPEQLRGHKVEAAADIFSLGVTFYQLLSGRPPFTADNLPALSYEIIHSKHCSVRALRKDLPASSARIVNRCLQKKPDNRYASAADLAADIRKALRRDFPQEARAAALLE